MQKQLLSVGVPQSKASGLFFPIHPIDDVAIGAVPRHQLGHHQAIAEPLVKLGLANLRSLLEKQAQEQEFLNQLPKINNGTNISDAKLSTLGLSIGLTMAKESEVQGVQLQIAEAELRLAAPNAQAAILPTPIFAPDRAAGLNWWFVLLITSASGLAIAAFWAFVKEALTKSAEPTLQM
jgi:hypothetical protein